MNKNSPWEVLDYLGEYLLLALAVYKQLAGI